KTKWTEAMAGTMLGILHEQILHGERAENRFKQKAWIAAQEALKEAYQINLEATQLKTKWLNLKKAYKIYTMINNNSEFGWDDQRAVLIALDSVWSTYLTAYPEVKKFQGRALLHYPILHEL
ncbi:hypothetical protein C7212DRAFT_150448, partial [Tuber magnatum]